MGGWIERQGTSWRIVLDIGRDENGNRRRAVHTQPPGSTERQAKRELRRLLAEVDAGLYAPPQKQTLADYLTTWLETTARLRVADRTLQTWRGWCRGRIIPALGRHRLDQLTTAHIQTAWAQMAFGIRHDTKTGPISADSVRTCHAILSSALRSAVKQGLLSRNPCSGVELPPLRRKEMVILNETQMAILLEVSRGGWLHLPILLAITTGMRRGEILALRWADVDIEQSVLQVHQSAQKVTGRPLSFKAPKSGKPRRITLPELLVTELRRHREEQARVHGLVVSHQNGTPINPDVLTKAFAALIARTDLPRIRFHGLRHSAATLLLSRGLGVNVVQERLGHAHPSVTLGVYGHVLEASERQAADTIDRALKGTGA